MVRQASRLWALLVSVCVWSIGSLALAEQKPVVFEKQIGDQTEKMSYLLYLPEGYDAGAEKKWPLVIFLHGSGERGDNIDLVKVHGPPKIVDKKPDFPAIVVSPQCPSGKRWDNIPLMSAWLDDIIAHNKVDTQRIYLTGLSMGGFGTWYWASEEPDRFAAIVPICGGGKPGTGEKLKDIPTWVFHGAKDTAVPLKLSEDMVKEMKEAGGNPKLTVYPDAGHDSWTATYNNQDMWDWLFSQKKS